MAWRASILTAMPVTLSEHEFVELARRPAERADGVVAVPVALRLLADQLTPALAYRRLVSEDERLAPSFLFESVEGGDRVGRHSIMGSRPAVEVMARGHDVTLVDHRAGGEPVTSRRDDPLAWLRAIARGYELRLPGHPARDRLPEALIGGWVGYASYDTVRYAEVGSLPWEGAPRDDRELLDLHFGLYHRVVVFDHAENVVTVVRLVLLGAGDDPAARYAEAVGELHETAERLQRHSRPLPSGDADAAPAQAGEAASNMTREAHAAMVRCAQEYIRAGDIFQVVVGQRFERRSAADPFDVYRALRVVNPSPYMVYLQTPGCILVASSPEILCRVRREERDGEARSIVTNRPLAGTRQRGGTPEEDAALERELLADQKEIAEHAMLVDLGRNDVGRVAEAASVSLDAVMEVERYSHVMHISSTVTGVLRKGLDCWDALRSTLPVGTISGAPKIRAMQIIDELEPVRRGPYGGGFGYVSLDGDMDMALALRTIVVPTHMRADDGAWTYHLQAAGGIVHDSEPGAEYDETRNKAAALVRAVELAEVAFGSAAREGRSPADEPT